MQIVKAQKVILSFASGDTTKDGTLTGFSTLSQIVPFTASAEIDADSNQIGQTGFDFEIVNTTTVRATRGVSGVAGTVIVYVVEFASTVSVQKGTWAIGTAATSDNNTISAVTLANSFVWHFQKSTTGAPASPATAVCAVQLSTTTNVNTLVNTAGSDHSGHFYVVEHSSLTVQRGSGAQTGSPGSVTITAVTLANAFCMVSQTTSGTQYEDESFIYYRLSTTTNLEVYPGYTSGIYNPYWQVIEDSEVTVQRFAATRNLSTASGSFTPTTVDLGLTVAHAGHGIGFNSSDEYDDAWDYSCRCTSYDLTTTTNCNWAKDANSGSAVVEIILFTVLQSTYKIEGVTKNSEGSILGSCDVYLFYNNVAEDTPTFLSHQVSNSTTGAYSFTGLAGSASRYFVIAKKDGTPNVFDTTDHVLIPVEE